MEIVKWRLLNVEKPKKEGIYKVFRYDYDRFLCEYLLWDKHDGFQPLNYGEGETYAINMNVTHWLKVQEPDIPIKEAKKILITTEVFFMANGLEEFAKENSILEYEKYGNAIEYITTGVGDNIMARMRLFFKSNGIHKNILKS